jgi:hypothetical protein
MLASGGMLWASLVFLGARVMYRYESEPGAPGAPPSTWPSGSSISPSNGKFTLVMLLHPDCPCSRASLVQLDRLIARVPEALAAIVLFSKPESQESEIRASELWEKASGMHGVSVIFDYRGLETGRFGGYVSGQTMLYGPDRRLVFSGGVTSSRGHEGDSAGMDALMLAVRGTARVIATAPVFGCALSSSTGVSTNQ